MLGKRINQRGFSLIELSVVIIISSILMVMMFDAYKQYSEKKKIYTTQARIDTVTSAMNRFFANYTRFPCPASKSASIGDPDFGVATSCYDESQGVGCNADYCVSSTQIDHDGDSFTPLVTRRVREGVIPLMTLKEGIDNDAAGVERSRYPIAQPIGAEDLLDAYGNQFTYVVTEYQARDEYIPETGAIEITNEHGGAGSVLASNVDYIILSHGENGAGARTIYGVPAGNGCVGLPANEAENCEDGDHVYMASIRYDAGPNQFDDILTYRGWMSYYLWDQSTLDPKDVYNTNAGYVGIDILSPQEQLHIAEGNVLLDQEAADYRGTGAATLMAKEYCTYDGTDVEGCFDPELIGGDGLECQNNPNNPLNVIHRIKDGAAECFNLYEDAAGVPQTQDVTCDPDEFLYGLEYDTSTRKIKKLCR